MSATLSPAIPASCWTACFCTLASSASVVGHTSGQCVNPKNTSVGCPRSVAGETAAPWVSTRSNSGRARGRGSAVPDSQRGHDRLGQHSRRRTRRRSPRRRRWRHDGNPVTIRHGAIISQTDRRPPSSRASQRRLTRARVFFGHGTDNARDEAAALVFHVMRLSHDAAPARACASVPTATQRARVEVAARRSASSSACRWPISRTKPGLRARVLRRRTRADSALAVRRAHRTTGLRPGSMRAACVACWTRHRVRLHRARRRRKAFPRARVDAVDIDSGALEVAAINRRRLRLTRRVRLIESDHFAALSGAVVRYHREQSALRRARARCVACRASTGTSRGMRSGVRTRGPRFGRSHPASRRAAPAAARFAGGRGRQHRARVAARVSAPAFHLARFRTRRRRSVSCSRASKWQRGTA